MNETKKEVVERLMQLQALMHRYHMQSFRNFAPFSNPHRGQGRVLSILKMKPEISQRELSYLLDMSKQSLAELLGKLEKSGYITRETAEDDRRVSNVKLTEEGARVADEMDDETPEIYELIDCLNDKELKDFSEYLRRIIECFEEQFPDNDATRKQMMERFMKRHDYYGYHRHHGHPHEGCNHPHEGRNHPHEGRNHPHEGYDRSFENHDHRSDSLLDK